MTTSSQDTQDRARAEAENEFPIAPDMDQTGRTAQVVLREGYTKGWLAREQSAQPPSSVLVEASRKTKEAWESLPGNTNYSPRQIEQWLIGSMKPVMDELRAALSAQPQQQPSVSVEQPREMGVTDLSRFDPSPSEYAAGMRCKNARQCGVCGAGADRYEHAFICQKNPSHVGDLVVGIFSDLAHP